jgi:hypothetical protein
MQTDGRKFFYLCFARTYYLSICFNITELIENRLSAVHGSGNDCLIPLNTSHYKDTVLLFYTGEFKKKATLSHVYNEVTSEPTITRYTTTVRKTLKVCL